MAPGTIGNLKINKEALLACTAVIAMVRIRVI